MRSKLNSSSALSRPNFDGIRLAIEYVATRRVWLRRRQLKLHSKGKIRKIADGIDRTGFNVPLLVDDELGLVSGHARLAAAELLGLGEVPVIRVSHLNDEQLRLFAIFDNKAAEGSDWDEHALNLEFSELIIDDPAIDLSDSGFAIAEIDALAGRARTDALSDFDTVQISNEQKPAVTTVGDIWQCGRHRIICGDSTDPVVIQRLVDGHPIRQLLADPPYNVPSRSISTTGRHADFAMAAGEMSEAAFISFLTRFFAAAQPALIDGALVFAFMDFKHFGELLAAGRAAGLSYIQLLVWVKASAGMGSLYRSGHELVGVFHHGKDRHRNNNMLGAFGRNRSNVLSYPGVMGKGGGGKKALELHPTVKNTALIADLMLDASAPGEAILDSFGGSGTTMIAAEKVERVAYLCELSPHFVDATVMRFNALGGAQATLVGTGQSFATVAGERAAHDAREER